MATPKPFRNLALPFSDLEHTKSPFPVFFTHLPYFVKLYNFKQMMFFSSDKGSEIVCKAFYQLSPGKISSQFKNKLFCYVKQSFNFTHDLFQNKLARLIQILVQNTIVWLWFLRNTQQIDLLRTNTFFQKRNSELVLSSELQKRN